MVVVVNSWRRRHPVLSSLAAAAVGSLAVIVITASVDVSTVTSPSPQAIIASAVVGAVVGWLYDIGSKMNATTQDSIAGMDRLAKILEYQREPLNMITKADVHSSTIGQLLRDSIGKQFRDIAYVDSNKYLHYLTLAIDKSSQFNGVQRYPVRWFHDGGRQEYLKRLSQKSMRGGKRRIFIVDDAVEMEKDLDNSELMAEYWECTGRVLSFWISSEAYRRTYNLQVPDDFALFDNELLIRYNDERQTLTFDLILKDGVSPERDVFTKLEEQIRQGASGPFKEMQRTPSRPRRGVPVA